MLQFFIKCLKFRNCIYKTNFVIKTTYVQYQQYLCGCISGRRVSNWAESVYRLMYLKINVLKAAIWRMLMKLGGKEDVLATGPTWTEKANFLFIFDGNMDGQKPIYSRY